MLLKTLAHAFASSKLKKEEFYTQSLVRKYEQESQQMQQRVHNQRVLYENKIKSLQVKRDHELKEYIDFMNGQIGLAAEYVPQLKQFQSLFFPCLNSWFQFDLCKKEIGFISQQMRTIESTMDLIKTYIKEIQNLQQYKMRKEWQSLTEQRALFKSSFITNTQQDIAKLSIIENLEFYNEIERLRSHSAALSKQKKELSERKRLLNINKGEVEQNYFDNKKSLNQQYKLCLNYWNEIKEKFEKFYAYKISDNDYVNQWCASCSEGGNLFEIRTLIRNAYEVIDSSRKEAQRMEKQFQYYKKQVEQAHKTENYDTFDKDKEKRDEYRNKKNDAFSYTYSLVEAKKILSGRRDEIVRYIDKIKILHPDSVIDNISLLLQNDAVLNTHKIFGISSRKQRCEYQKQKVLGVKNAK